MKWSLFLLILLNYFSLFSMERAEDYYNDCKNPFGILTLNFSKRPKDSLFLRFLLASRFCTRNYINRHIELLNMERFGRLQEDLSDIARKVFSPCDIALYFDKSHLSEQNSFLQLQCFLIWLSYQQNLVGRIRAISLADNSLNAVPHEALRSLNYSHSRYPLDNNLHVAGNPLRLFLCDNNFTTNDQKNRILGQLTGINVSF
ncbi:hypothetical protein E3J79_01550 [Candidatus Dependentiae bacterium]|nr:MAG: hypothetical protein E3J79_01550 [Candidatus Dependentiae bacterium]